VELFPQKQIAVSQSLLPGIASQIKTFNSPETLPILEGALPAIC